jgi:hypothetical protein
MEGQGWSVKKIEYVVSIRLDSYGKQGRYLDRDVYQAGRIHLAGKKSHIYQNP